MHGVYNELVKLQHIRSATIVICGIIVALVICGIIVALDSSEP